MKRIYTNFIIAAVAIFAFSCSKDDGIIKGEINETNKVDMTTFDLLKSMDETKNVALLFEKAGMKNAVNGDVTIVSPNQWSIDRYLRRRHNQDLRSNPKAPVITIDDLSQDDLAQMGMYILPGKWSRETIPAKGKILVAHDGSEVFISLDQVNTDPSAAWDGGGQPGRGYQYSNFTTELPYVIHAHFKRGDNWEWTAGERLAIRDTYNNPECDQVYRMYVSDIITTNGVVHVLYCGDYVFSDLYYYHSLFFYGTTLDDKL